MNRDGQEFDVRCSLCEYCDLFSLKGECDALHYWRWYNKHGESMTRPMQIWIEYHDRKKMCSSRKVSKHVNNIADAEFICLRFIQKLKGQW